MWKLMSSQMTFNEGSGRTTQQSQRAQFVACTRNPHTVFARIVAPSVGEREAMIIANDISPALGDAPAKAKWLVLDLSAVSVLSSMGLGMCVDLRNQARKQGMKTVLYGLNGHLRDLFRMMKVERLYKVVHSQDDLNSLTGG